MERPDTLLFSIVIPVYNKERYLRRCIGSILSQTHLNFEAIFVDDGSTDKSAEVIESFKDPRFRILRQTNKGVSAARNLGIQHSRSPFVAFLDADDEWLPNHLETLSFLISTYKEGGIYSTGFKLTYEDGSPSVELFVLTKKNVRSLVIKDPFPLWSIDAISNCSNTAVPTTVLYEAGLFREGENENEDMDLWVRIGMQRPLVISPVITSIYHRTGFDGKPRFRKWPLHILSCKTAAQLLLDGKGEFSIAPSSIKRYINAWVSKYFWSLVSANAREPLNVILENSGASIFAPMYYRLGQAAFLWPIVRLVGWIKKPIQSRLALRLMGGTRIRNGVVVRIVKNEASSWLSYLFRKRKRRGGK